MVRESVKWRASLTWTPAVYPAIPLTEVTMNSSAGGKLGMQLIGNLKEKAKTSSS